jgi:1,4-dihydroxy-6-naphthoate synthase
LDFKVELIDIQQLNDRLFEGDFDVAKSSFHAALLLADQTIVLPSGSALGFGVGPLLLSAREHDIPRERKQLTLIPGKHTTAALLYGLFYPETTNVEQTLFYEIMPRLRNRTADFGVCIHEGRFTWQNERLSLVEDLGTRWERETDCPLPLGGIVARRSLAPEVIRLVQAVIHDSLQLALSNPSLALPTMRRYAQEFDDHVMMQHVQLYVNEWTVDLGEVGRRSLLELSKRAIASGLIPPHSYRIEVLPI